MDLDLSKYLHLTTQYTSASQRARVLTEVWVAENFLCLTCDRKISALPANTRACDFQCESCNERYQLKSSSKNLSNRILGAEYHTTLTTVRLDRHPSLILLQYNRDNFSVANLKILHGSWITENVVIPRSPLRPPARRAGWQGCIIDLRSIPASAFVEIIKDGQILPQVVIKNHWQTARAISSFSNSQRTWLSLVLHVVDNLPANFSLQDIYKYEEKFIQYHPKNKNIRAKIRQQLQIARDLGLIKFLEPSVYQKTK